MLAVTVEALMQLRIGGHLPMQHLRNCKMVQKVIINTVLATVEQRDASEAKPDANGSTTPAEGMSVEEREQYKMV